MLLETAIKDFLLDCKVRKLSSKTIHNYSLQLDYWKRFWEEEHQIENVEDVSAYHIKSFLAIMDDKGRTPCYINDLLKVVKTFFGYCKREEYMKIDPALKVKKMKQPKRKIITFSEKEIKSLLNYFKGMDFISIRNKAILATFFDTGIRLSELIYLKQEQIRDECMLIHGKGNKERMVPVSPYLEKILLRYQMVRDAYFAERLHEGYFFLSRSGYHLTEEGICKFFKQAAKEVGVCESVRVSPHTCRHTFAHIQLKNGLDLYTLSRLMGHESVAITQRYLEGLRDDEVLSKAQKTGVLNNL